MKPPRPVAFYGVGLLLAVGFLALPAAAPGTEIAAQPQDSVVTMGENSAEITLPRPTRYVVLLHEAGKVRTLHTRGDVLFHPQDPGRSITIERIDGETILLRESHKTQARTVRVGKPIPGFPACVSLRPSCWRRLSISLGSSTI